MRVCWKQIRRDGDVAHHGGLQRVPCTANAKLGKLETTLASVSGPVVGTLGGDGRNETGRHTSMDIRVTYVEP